MKSASLPLKFGYVFLDTEVFTGEKFDFEASKLAEIRKLAKVKKIRLIFPHTALSECEKRIEKMVTEAVNAMRKTRDKSGILRHAKKAESLWKMALTAEDKKNLTLEIQKRFHQFLLDSNAEQLPTSDVSISELFEDYDKGKPPFGRDQKKDQFPDAVAMLTLRKWCEKKGATVYIVSNDPDVKSVCEAFPSVFHYKSGVAEFLNEFYENEEDLKTAVEQILSEKRSLIEQRAKELFEAAGFYVTGEDGDAEDIEVQSVKLLDHQIVSRGEDWVIVEQRVDIEFTASVSYKDFSTGNVTEGVHWDYDTEHANVRRTEMVALEIEINLYKDLPDYVDLTVFIPQKDFEIAV